MHLSAVHSTADKKTTVCSAFPPLACDSPLVFCTHRCFVGDAMKTAVEADLANHANLRQLNHSLGFPLNHKMVIVALDVRTALRRV